MPRSEDRFEDFHAGLSAGYDAGQNRDLLYAVGFLAGFVWGAVASIRGERPRAVPVEATR